MGDARLLSRADDDVANRRAGQYDSGALRFIVAPSVASCSPMAYRPHRLEPNYPGPHVVTTKTPAPPVVVECWCLMVATMNRVRLDMFTRETWRTFDPTDLEPLERQFATSRL